MILIEYNHKTILPKGTYALLTNGTYVLIDTTDRENHNNIANLMDELNYYVFKLDDTGRPLNRNDSRYTKIHNKDIKAYSKVKFQFN